MSSLLSSDLRPEMRQKVLDAAARLFRDRGYAGTTMRAVAGRCGIRAASLYHHFPSKDDILAEVFDYGVRRVAAAVRAAVDRLPPSASAHDKVRAAVHAHLESFFVYGDYTASNIRVFGQAPRPVQRKNRGLRDRYEAYWHLLLEEARQRGELRRGVDLSIARLFLIAIGTPANGRSSPGRTAAAAAIASSWKTSTNAFSSGFSASMRSSEASTSSRAASSPEWTRAASSRAGRKSRSSAREAVVSAMVRGRLSRRRRTMSVTG